MKSNRMSEKVVAGVALAIFWCAVGCDERRDSDKGKVNVRVNTPAGDYGVNVEYPKGHHKHDHETRIDVDHD